MVKNRFSLSEITSLTVAFILECSKISKLVPTLKKISCYRNCAKENDKWMNKERVMFSATIFFGIIKIIWDDHAILQRVGW